MDVSKIFVLASYLALSACGSTDDDSRPKDVFGVAVDAQAPAPKFSWNGAPVHSLTVWNCESACGPGAETYCADGEYHRGSAFPAAVWVVEPVSYEPLPEPAIASPVEYGATIPNTIPMEATPLAVGTTYAVELLRFTPCEDDSPDCWYTSAAGCEVFTFSGP
jgi:hypothetical protein